MQTLQCFYGSMAGPKKEQQGNAKEVGGGGGAGDTRPVTCDPWHGNSWWMGPKERASTKIRCDNDPEGKERTQQI